MKNYRNALIIAAAGALALVAAGCDDSETIAPDGSTISLNPNPAFIIVSGGVQSVPVEILATVRNSIGVPLPGQDVRFTTNNGVLTPQGGLPVETDDFGNAICVLDESTGTAQVTATSGKATASITINSAPCAISAIVLDPPQQDLQSCSDELTYTATVLCQGVPAEGVTVEFKFVDTGTGFVSGQFVPGTGQTDENGVVTTELDITDNVCTTECVGVGKSCNTRVRATGQNNTPLSNDSTINDVVP